MTPELGVIEGYYGKPWSPAERVAVIDRLAAAGYGFFHYAPKFDSHLRRDWRGDHSPEDWDELARLARHCAGRAVRFGVGLSPYNAHLAFDAATRRALAAKLRKLDTLGLHDLAILFDDMRGDLVDLAERQAEIVAFCQDHSAVSRFFVCPSYYSDDPVLDRVFGARPSAYLETFGRLIDPQVSIYWTGEQVCSPEISVGHLRTVAQQLGRKVCLWDNYPVNDGPIMSNYLHLRGFTGRSAEIAGWITGHAINPAVQPTLSCIPALTLIDLYRQGEGYSYFAAFAAAAEKICGSELASLLRNDLLTLQGQGLDRLGARREKILARYSAIAHPAASEVTAWLAGEYAMTGEALLTQ